MNSKKEIRNKKAKNKSKSKKLTFILILVCIALALEIAVVYKYLLKRYKNKDFGITTYVSEVDKDGEKIDDQTDILKNTKEYIKTRPKYKSKYYATGYPNDEYGVCTDVIAIALKNSGYDLMELVNEDIKNNKELYNIEKADKNIDFRRVVNLNVYFKRHVISLTTDINDIDAWQGGDIIVFKKHIGIISDRRNKNGIPYLIHHSNPFQIYYEENILENRDDIIGHYRIS